MAWTVNGTPITLSSAGSNLTITDLDASNTVMYMTHKISTGSNMIHRTQLGDGSISTSGYKTRFSYDGGTDVTTSDVDISSAHSGEAVSAFTISFLSNPPTEEKLMIDFAVGANSSGTAPRRGERYAVWTYATDRADQLKVFTDSNPY